MLSPTGQQEPVVVTLGMYGTTKHPPVSKKPSAPGVTMTGIAFEVRLTHNVLEPAPMPRVVSAPHPYVSVHGDFSMTLGRIPAKFLASMVSNVWEMRNAPLRGLFVRPLQLECQEVGESLGVSVLLAPTTTTSDRGANQTMTPLATLDTGGIRSGCGASLQEGRRILCLPLLFHRCLLPPIRLIEVPPIPLHRRDDSPLHPIPPVKVPLCQSS